MLVLSIIGVILGIQLFIKYMIAMILQSDRKVFKKMGDADPEIIYGGDQCCYAHVMLNDKIYAIGDYNMFELIDGEYVNERYLNIDRLNSQRTIVYNNEIYSIESNSNTIVKLVMSEEEYTYQMVVHMLIIM